MAETLYQLFSPLENKLVAYSNICTAKSNVPDNLNSFIFTDIEFGIIDNYIFSYDAKTALPYITYLLQCVNTLLFKNENIDKLTEVYKTSIDYGNIELNDSDSNKIKTELNGISDKLIEYKNYFESRDKEISIHVSKLLSPLKKDELQTTLAKDLLHFVVDGNDLFDRTQNEGTLKANIIAFITGNFATITPSLDFLSNQVNIAYYIIHSIQKNSTFQLKDIFNVSINGKKFKAAGCSIAVSKINQKLNSNSLSKDSSTYRTVFEINELIAKHLR
jgi:hypothetical protein